MRKIVLITLVLAVGAAMLLIVPAQTVSAQPAHAKASCTNRSGVGTYGYNCGGVAPNPFKDGYPVEPFAGYGVVSADGKGQWNGYGKVSFNGKVVKWTHDTRPNDPSVVNHDCTGSVTYAVMITDGAVTFPVPDAHFEFVIVDNGKEVKGFPVDPGYAVSCQLILTSDNE
jgi:hypothetical protein